MTATPICPHCGYDLRRSEPLEDRPFRYDPLRGFQIGGSRLSGPRQVHELLGSIMAMRGRIGTPAVLAERLGYGGDQPDGIVRVLLSQARKRVAETGHRFPVETVWGVGLRWDVNASPSAGVKRRASS